MSLHHDLLEQARHLALKEPKKPRQASLRRAVSTAYYALFHMFLHDATTLLFPSSPAALRARASRAFSHGEARSVCDMFESTSGGIRGLTTHPLEVELTDVARIFVQLQEARHLADYDLAAVFDRDQVLNYVDKTQLAMEKWKAIKNTPNANVFLTALLLHGRWSKWNK